MIQGRFINMFRCERFQTSTVVQFTPSLFLDVPIGTSDCWTLEDGTDTKHRHLLPTYTA